MNKIKSIKSVLKTIYHQKLDCYLDNKNVLSDVIENNGSVKCVFIEPAGSIEIKSLKNQIESEIFKLSWVNSVEIGIKLMETVNSNENQGLENVKNIIAVSSCKGGVGKSTISLNLAAALSMNGAQVGVFDADIHGPSLPAMIKPSDIASSLDEEMLPPFLNNNIKLMSYGYIQSQANQPAILRGPIASNVLKQLLFKTDWGYLDYLIVDCPPGTGDILLSLTQEIKLSGAVIVTNPHELSYIDVQKGIEMFRKVNVPIFSLIENMSYFICSNCDEKHHVFGSGKLQSFAKKYHLPQWFDLPIDKELANFQHKDSPFLFTCNNDNPTKAVIDRLANETIWQIANQKNDDEVSVSFDNENQEITFFQGEKEKTYTFKDLRLNCKCAYCVDEVSGEQLFFEENCDPNIKINHSFKVGHYAQGIEWLENGKTHQSMYSFKDLLI